MNENGETTQTTDRGFTAIVDRIGNGSNCNDSKEMRTARAIPEIIKALAGLPDRQVQNVFHAVQAIKRTAANDSVQSIVDEYEAKREAKQGEKKRGWFSKK